MGVAQPGAQGKGQADDDQQFSGQLHRIDNDTVKGAEIEMAATSALGG